MRRLERDEARKIGRAKHLRGPGMYVCVFVCMCVYMHACRAKEFGLFLEGNEKALNYQALNIFEHDGQPVEDSNF